MSERLKDKVAIVTGGAGYIGTAITESLSREGARVVIADFKPEQFEALKSKVQVPDLDRITFVQTDATDNDQIHNMTSEVISKFGQIDILVTLVGGSKDAMIHKMTDEQWDQVMDLNLRTMFLACRAVVPHMRERQYGKIILMSSRSYLGNIGQTNYSTAKAGVIGFTNSLAREMARYRINVNAVVPGFIDNPRLANMEEKYRKMRIELNPFQDAAEPEDVAEVVLFLASDESRQVTGQSIRVACW